MIYKPSDIEQNIPSCPIAKSSLDGGHTPLEDLRGSSPSKLVNDVTLSPGRRRILSNNDDEADEDEDGGEETSEVECELGNVPTYKPFPFDGASLSLSLCCGDRGRGGR